MGIALNEPVAPSAPKRPRVDTLATSVVILLVMTVAQRLIGFGRGIVFCRWLEPEQLGQWDVAFGFLNLAAPLSVLGLPGAFGRYVEYFRHRGQFHTFLRRTIVVCSLSCLALMAAMVIQPDWFARLIFGTDADSQIVIWLALCLGTVGAHNFLASLFIAVRMYRIVTVLQFVQSLGFAILSLGLLSIWHGGATCAVIAYAAATVLSGVGAVGWLRHLSAGEPVAEPPVAASEFWAKLLPFAVWVWVSNLVANLFEIIDRYLIIHYSGMEVDEALRTVGYYHTSRIIPVLFVAIAGLLGAMITPHLSHDWEMGRRTAVVRRLNLVLKTLLAALFACSIVVLCFAGLLFRVAFQNKFPEGLQVLPLTLAYCAWFGTISVAQNYLWCAERPRLSSSALFIGLLLNIALNLILLPRYGLHGAVWATTFSNFAALSLVYLLSRWQGMHVDLGTWLLTLAPAALWLGLWPALAVLAGFVIASVLTNYVFSADEKQHLLRAVKHGADKLRRWCGKDSRQAAEVVFEANALAPSAEQG